MPGFAGGGAWGAGRTKGFPFVKHLKQVVAAWLLETYCRLAPNGRLMKSDEKDRIR